MLLNKLKYMKQLYNVMRLISLYKDIFASIRADTGRHREPADYGRCDRT